jgi:hypothetical protein
VNLLLTSSPSYKRTPIRRVTSLANALGCTVKKLNYVSARADDLYRVAQAIPKNDGSFRHTFDAKPLLKGIQSRIKTEILDHVIFPAYLTGSIKGRDYKTNAELHKGAAIVIAEDIGCFFPSTTADHVFDIWMSFFGFSEDVAKMLTSLTTRNGELPQGAITSPQLANLIFWREEPLLHQRFSAEGLVYSRFVDDISVSSQKAVSPKKKTEIVAAIYGLMLRGGFKPKRRKHELKTARQQMTVTKLTINQKPGIPKAERARIRAAVHRLEKQVAQKAPSVDIKSEFASVLGKVNHLSRFHPGEASPLKDRLLQLKC